MVEYLQLTVAILASLLSLWLLAGVYMLVRFLFKPVLYFSLLVFCFMVLIK